MAKHVKMPCGWKCGAFLGSREIRAHFGLCPNRPSEVFDPKVSQPLGIQIPRSDEEVRAEVRAELGYKDEDDPVSTYAALIPGNIAQMTAGRPPAAPRNVSEIVAKLKAEIAPLESRSQPVDVSGYEEVEDEPEAARRSWAAEWAKMSQMDPDAANDRFLELLKGRRVPASLSSWKSPVKIAWLEENCPLPPEGK